MKKTINLPAKLHQAVKIEAAKRGLSIEALIAKTMWKSLGGTYYETCDHCHTR